MKLFPVVVTAAVLAVACAAGPYGEATKPLMGWNSWNAFGPTVNQSVIEAVMVEMVNASRTVNGSAISFSDLGYNTVTVGDGWQACGAGVNGSFHDKTGYPLVDTKRFPDLSGMVKKAQAFGLSVSITMNNCVCQETHDQLQDPAFVEKVYAQSVKFLVHNGMEGVALLGCSMFSNTTKWAELLQETSLPFVVQNQGASPPPVSPNQFDGHFPYNTYATEGSPLGTSWNSVMAHVLSVIPFQSPPSSGGFIRPGLWADPGLMQVGNLDENTFNVNRAHFGAWLITGAPLMLGYDLRNGSMTDMLWKVVGDESAIEAVAQSPWAGGFMAKTFLIPDNNAAGTVSNYTLWARPMSQGGKVAVLVLSNSPTDTIHTVTFNYTDVGIPAGTTANVYCLWVHREKGVFTDTYTTDSFGGHDSRLYMVSPLGV